MAQLSWMKRRVTYVLYDTMQFLGRAESAVRDRGIVAMNKNSPMTGHYLLASIYLRRWYVAVNDYMLRGDDNEAVFDAMFERHKQQHPYDIPWMPRKSAAEKRQENELS